MFAVPTLSIPHGFQVGREHDVRVVTDRGFNKVDFVRLPFEAFCPQLPESPVQGSILAPNLILLALSKSFKMTDVGFESQKLPG